MLVLKQESYLITDGHNQQNYINSLAAWLEANNLPNQLIAIPNCVKTINSGDLVVVSWNTVDNNRELEFAALAQTRAKIFVHILDTDERDFLLGENLFKLLTCWTDASVSLKNSVYAGAYLSYKDGICRHGSFADTINIGGAPYAELLTIENTLDTLINNIEDIKNYYLYLYTDSEWSIASIYGVLEIYYSINCLWEQKKYKNLKSESIERVAKVIDKLLIFGGFKLKHIKGHKGIIGNEFCDKLALETRLSFQKRS